MGRTKDEKLVYFAKLKDLIETYRKYTPWDSFEDVASFRDVEESGPRRISTI